SSDLPGIKPHSGDRYGDPDRPAMKEQMTDDSFSSAVSPHPPARPRLGMARGSAPWLLPTLGAAGAAVLAARGSRARAVAAVPVVALAAGVMWFFRDSEGGAATGLILSGADGVVLTIRPQPDG